MHAKCLSLIVGGNCASFGRNSVLVPPLRISGEGRIAIGDRVYVGAGSWLQTLPDEGNSTVAISIGSGTSISGSCVISSVRSVILEEDVLLARNVYIADHMHKYSQTELPVLAQGLDRIQPVLIKKGAWLGQNVVICPGVTIGRGAVIGANSTVNRSVPDFCVAVGSPARVIKTFDPSTPSLAGHFNPSQKLDHV